MKALTSFTSLSSLASSSLSVSVLLWKPDLLTFYYRSCRLAEELKKLAPPHAGLSYTFMLQNILGRSLKHFIVALRTFIMVSQLRNQREGLFHQTTISVGVGNGDVRTSFMEASRYAADESMVLKTQCDNCAVKMEKYSIIFEKYQMNTIYSFPHRQLNKKTLRISASTGMYDNNALFLMPGKRENRKGCFFSST